MQAHKYSFRNILNKIGKFLSWVIFAILMIAAAFLLYYYIATKIYEAKGPGYEPKFSIYTIVSQSMTPSIKVYDAVVDMRVDDPKDIKVGDVISFISTSLLTPGKNITHRVIGITKDIDGNVCYQTKGDYNAVADDSCAKFNNVLGKVMFKIPQLGRIQFLLASKSGWLIFIMIPALIIIIKDILKITKLATIKDKASKISEDEKPDEEKIKQEALRKEELKQKLLKEDNKDIKNNDDEIKNKPIKKVKGTSINHTLPKTKKQNNSKNKQKNKGD